MRFHLNNCSLKLLITGGQGQLASALRHHPLAHQHALTICSKNELDITTPSSIQQAIQLHQPDVVINTAAYTAVDKAEQAHQLALLVNHSGAKNLAIACEENQIPLIHFSTDYIFDGRQTLAYHENDAANPLNVYGLSKYLGEEAIRNHVQRHIILRISGLFSEYGNNFLKTILHLAIKKDKLQIVRDQITCPTDANDVATMCFTLIKTLRYWGTYHYCNLHPNSWYDFAIAIIETAKKDLLLSVKQIDGMTSAQYTALAKRPAYSVLNCNKIYNDYGITQSSWDQHLSSIIYFCAQQK